MISAQKNNLNNVLNVTNNDVIGGVYNNVAKDLIRTSARINKEHEMSKQIENPKSILNCEFNNGELLISQTLVADINKSVVFTNDKMLEAITQQMKSLKIDFTDEQVETFKEENFIDFDSHALDWLQSKDDRIKSYKVKDVKRNGKLSWSDGQKNIESVITDECKRMVDNGETDEDGNPLCVYSVKYGYLTLTYKSGKAVYKAVSLSFVTRANVNNAQKASDVQDEIDKEVSAILNKTVAVLDETETENQEDDLLNQ